MPKSRPDGKRPLEIPDAFIDGAAACHQSLPDSMERSAFGPITVTAGAAKLNKSIELVITTRSNYAMKQLGSNVCRRSSKINRRKPNSMTLNYPCLIDRFANSGM